MGNREVGRAKSKVFGVLVVALAASALGIVYRRQLNTRLLDSAAAGEIASARRALDGGADPNYRGRLSAAGAAAYARLRTAGGDPGPHTAAELATSVGAEDVVLELLERGARPNALNDCDLDRAIDLHRRRLGNGPWEVPLNAADSYWSGWIFRRALSARHDGLRERLGLNRSSPLGEYAVALDTLLNENGPTAGAVEAGVGSAHLTEMLALSRAIRPRLPSGQNVVRLEPYPSAWRRTGWIALSTAERLRPYGSAKLQPRLTLWEGPEGKPRCAGTITLDDPGRQGSEWQSLQLRWKDMDADGRPEAVLQLGSPAHTVGSCYLHVLRWNGEGLRRTFGLRSTLPLQLEDLNGDGTCEIAAWQLTSPGKPPLRQALYTWRDGRYVGANQEFPEPFRTLHEEMRQTYSGRSQGRTAPGFFQRVRDLQRALRRRPHAASTSPS